MFELASRYYNIKIVSLKVTDREGVSREIQYVQRRFIPAAREMTTLVEHTVTQGDRLDNITARYLADPSQFWRVCDASNAMNPVDLTAELGRAVRVPVPQVG